MANKYLAHGNTYCGDGTSSADAASAGAAGAWNNINVLEGSAPAYGTLAAGDVVYLKSKDNTGADITRTLAANGNIGSSNATAGSPITWILDGGTVWPGSNGVLKHQSTGAYVWTWITHNHFIAQTKYNWVFYLSTTYTTATLTIILRNFNSATGLYFDFGLSDLTRGCAIGASTTHNSAFIDCGFKSAGRYSYLLAAQAGSFSTTKLVNCEIELTNASETAPVFQTDTSRIELVGGRIFGAGATTGVPVAEYTSGTFLVFGTQIPPSMNFANGYDTNGRALAFASGYGLDGIGGGSHHTLWGTMSSRTDQYFPYLNAILPDSAATGWSWNIYPYAAKPGLPAGLTISKMYSDTAAAKTVTLEMLVGSGFDELNARNTVLQVSYIDDTTGTMKSVSSLNLAAGALTTSTAAWSATTYGAYSFNKRNLSITTPTSIKQDTLVTAQLLIAQPAIDGTDMLIVCPDIQLT